MYSIITTKAIVLKSYDAGEKDVTISLFTKDLGQIYAKVLGVRDLSSKHRYALQEYSFVDVSLVQGKLGWKVTSSNFIKSYYFEISEKNKKETILKIISLVKRMYLGEEANIKIFESLLCGLDKIINSKNQKDVELIEAQTVADFLYYLGYVGQQPTADSQKLKELRRIINEGIKSSGL